jgi:hypothetical protein
MISVCLCSHLSTFEWLNKSLWSLVYIYIYSHMCVCVCVCIMAPEVIWKVVDKSMPLKWKMEWCPMCRLWWKSSCELQGMYGLQGPTKENIPTSPFETIHSSVTNQTNLTYSTRSNICSNNQTKFLCCHKYRARSTHELTSSANHRYTRLKK